jgi:hypothetical protein
MIIFIDKIELMIHAIKVLMNTMRIEMIFHRQCFIKTVATDMFIEVVWIFRQKIKRIAPINSQFNTKTVHRFTLYW